MLRTARLVGRKVSRGARGCWQIVEVAAAHVRVDVLPGRRGATRDDVAALTHAMADADVISFDLYDTLMARVIDEPQRVHTAVRLVALERGLAVPTDWEEVRGRAERRARAQTTSPDIRYDDIYDQMDLASETAAPLKALELEIESGLLQKARRGGELYAAALATGKPVVVTSDMYLPKRILVSSLRRAGYVGEERVIVSGDDGVAKQDGSAFVHLAREFPTQAVMHIGDDTVKDVKRAKGSGVDGHLLPRPAPARRGGWAGSSPRSARSLTATEALQASIIRALHESYLGSARGAGQHERVRAVGYSVLGPLLVGFSSYLDQTARSRGADRLVFLAREGAILKRGYQALLGTEALTSEYGVLSSRILGAANLTTELNAEDLRFLTKSPIALTTEQFVRRVMPAVDDDRLAAALRGAGLPPERKVHGLLAERALTPVFAALSNDLAQIVAETKGPLTDYLRSLRLDDSHALVVDTGWVGTLQTAMGGLLGTSVGGVYIGVHDTPASRGRSGMSGWVDGRLGGKRGSMARALYAHAQPLEVLLANPTVGSVVGIRTDSLASGDFSFRYLPSEFSPTAWEAVDQLQGAALEFVEDWKGAVSGLGEATAALALDPAVAPVLQLVTRPTLPQYRALGQMPFDGTYGVQPTVLGRWWVPDQFRRRA